MAFSADRWNGDSAILAYTRTFVSRKVGLPTTFVIQILTSQRKMGRPRANMNYKEIA
jgi:hypothetical protein